MIVEIYPMCFLKILLSSLKYIFNLFFFTNNEILLIVQLKFDWSCKLEAHSIHTIDFKHFEGGATDGTLAHLDDKSR